MVKQYLRYEAAITFGVIASPQSNIIYDVSGKLLISAALENCAIWNIKQGTVVRTLSFHTGAAGQGGKSEVTSIARPVSDSPQVAVGYSDGAVRLWDSLRGVCTVSLSGHRNAVTALSYNRDASLLASGSRDTDIIVWDALAETGLYRFRGHLDEVTDLVFLEKGSSLLSSSKDGTLRVWDLETQHCVQTVVDHRCQIWTIDVHPEEHLVVTGSADALLRVYELEGQELKPLGNVQRQSGERAVTVQFSPSGSLLGCQPAGKVLEIYRVRSQVEAAKHAKRRLRRKREKQQKVGDGEEEQNLKEATALSAGDVISLLQVVRTKQKIRSFAFSPAALKAGVEAQAALALHSNCIEVWNLLAGDASECISTISQAGHRSDIRAVTLCQDGALLLSMSHSAVKVWNALTGTCLRSMESGYGLCGLFVPGSRQAVVGTKAGAIELFDITAAEQLEVYEAHSGAVWALAANPDGSGFASASADHSVKFWEYELVTDSIEGQKRLSISPKRTLQMSQDVLCVRYSPTGKHVAVALLDSTMKVYFADTLKFMLALYGHALPVLAMDISSDGTLLVSGSADKNIRIWGLDFGDCHKSLFAHADSVMQVQFVRGTHYFFTAGKDRLVKYWDADKYEHLLTLEGHHAEVWALAVSPLGDFIITGSHDRSLRRWERTEEPFFVEEEREKRLESLFDEEAEEGDRGGDRKEGEADSVVMPGVATRETRSAADAIIEALDMAAHEKGSNTLSKDGAAAEEVVVKAVSTVRAADLQQALLTLPYIDALKLLEFIDSWLKSRQQVELGVRTALLLLRMHQQQLLATPGARQLLSSMHSSLHSCVKELKDTMGFNVAAIGHIQKVLVEKTSLPSTEVALKLRDVRAKLALSPLERGTKRRKRKVPTTV